MNFFLDLLAARVLLCRPVGGNSVGGVWRNTPSGRKEARAIPAMEAEEVSSPPIPVATNADRGGGA